MNYTPVIGLEVHVELKTASKMFCSCSAAYFGKQPNTHTCPVCLGLPGALPVPNKKAIEWCIMIALALNCKINTTSKFDRKNYFYPDLSKGYQISQYDQPFGRDGSLTLKIKNEKLKTEKEKFIRITRVHMEEDTAKLTHQLGNSNKNDMSLIDFNRSGVPLVEIVTEPDFESTAEVVEYLKKLQQIVRYLGASNADMEKGDMRLEPNISLREISNDKFQMTNFKLPNYKVEVKNINSFRFVEKAIQYETKRQAEILDRGEVPPQETRGWNEIKNATVLQRSKENAHDYRYFPEPDIPPIHITKSQISNLKSQMPELPNEKLTRFQKEFILSAYDAEILTRERDIAEYFETAVRVAHEIPSLKSQITNKTIANYIVNKKIDPNDTTPAAFIELIKSQTAFEHVDETTLAEIIQEVLTEQEKAVADYKAGKDPVIMFLLGQVMRKLGKKVDTQMVKAALVKALQYG